jgi:MFS family permease
MGAFAGGRRLLGLLLLHSVLTQVITFVLRPTSAYRAIELGVPSAWLGALTASFAVVPLVLALPSGQATDRFGARRVMVVGDLLLAAAGAVFLIDGLGAAGLVAGSVVLGTGHLCAIVAQQSAVANAAGPGTFDSVFGYYTFAAALGQALGPILIPVIGGRGAIPRTEPIFATAIVLGLVLLLSTAALRIPPRERVESAGRGGGLAGLLRVPGLVRALLVSCVVLAAVDITLVYLPAVGADRGLAAGLVGVLLTLRAVASMVSRLFLGRLVKRLGRRRVLVTSVARAAVSMGAIALPVPPLAIGALVLLLGLGLGVGQPLTMSWVAEVAPAGLRGRAMSLRLTGNRLGQVLIPSAVGLLAAGVGAAGVLGATAGALALVGAAARRLQVDSP